MDARIVLADACGLFREGLRMIIDMQPDLHVVAMATNGHEVLEATSKHHPNVVVLDPGLPVLNGIDVTRQLRSDPFGPHVLGLSAHTDSQHLAGLLTAGAAGYLLKEDSVSELIRAIRVVANGDAYLSPKITSEVIAGYVQSHKRKCESSRITQLTSRERQILQLVSEGIEGKAAAGKLGVSPKTIYTHLEHVMHKLNARGIADLTKHAVREGLTTL